MTMRTYAGQDLTVYWYPELCIHARACVKILPQVFRPDQRPWVDLGAAGPRDVLLAIDRCPSGALRYSRPEGSSLPPEAFDGPGRQSTTGEGEPSPDAAGRPGPAADDRGPTTISVLTNGPLMVQGRSRLTGPNGDLLTEAGRLTLCRCGLSSNRPYCDGSHASRGWKVDPEPGQSK